MPKEEKQNSNFYPQPNQNLDLANIEKEILKFWQENQVFEKSIEIRNFDENHEEDIVSPVEESCKLNNHYHCNHLNSSNDNARNEFVFYDGPPFANGLPHYGHLLTGFIKDLFARYQTMKGKKVERKFGWDTHGLPVEMETEKELTAKEGRAISGQIAIQEYGIEKFNQACQSSVMKYADKWEEYVTRQGRFVDFKDSYKTMDVSYMESVIWAFKELYNKGLIYEKLRVVPYSWACQTPLSNFETRMDNAYRQKESKAITVKFNIAPASYSALLKKMENCNEQIKAEIFNANCQISFLVWTTTPWTLPSNLALAVGKNINYTILASNVINAINDNKRQFLIIANKLTGKYSKELEGFEPILSIAGADLLGLKYQPLFPYFVNHPKLIACDKVFSVLSGDFVSTEDGTGIVHLAPAFGEDDQIICEENGVPTICPVNEGGKFTNELFDIEY